MVSISPVWSRLACCAGGLRKRREPLESFQPVATNDKPKTVPAIKRNDAVHACTRVSEWSARLSAQRTAVTTVTDDRGTTLWPVRQWRAVNSRWQPYGAPSPWGAALPHGPLVVIDESTCPRRHLRLLTCDQRRHCAKGEIYSANTAIDFSVYGLQILSLCLCLHKAPTRRGSPRAGRWFR